MRYCTWLTNAACTMVQLHGDETPKYCEKIADYVSVVKAFRLSENDNIDWMIRPYMDMCDMFMFDYYGSWLWRHGEKIQLGYVETVTVGKPFFLSGGIEPGDEAKLKEFSKEPGAKALFAVDINSKFEVSPGVKDMEKLRAFMREIG